MKETITKILEDRKVVLNSTADAIRRSLLELDTQARTERERLSEVEAELVDIDEALNPPAPVEE